MTKNLPVKEKAAQVRKCRVSNNMKLKRPTPRNIIVKMSKIKNKGNILRSARGKHLGSYKGPPITLSADFSTETLQTRKNWH